MFLDRCRTPTPPPRAEQQPAKRVGQQPAHHSSTPLPCKLACSSKRSESPIRKSKQPHANRAASHGGSVSGLVSKSYRERSPQQSNTTKRFPSRSPSLSLVTQRSRSRSRSCDSQKSVFEGSQYGAVIRRSADQRSGKLNSASSANNSSLSTSSSLCMSEERKTLPTGRSGITGADKRAAGKVATDIFPMSEGSK